MPFYLLNNLFHEMRLQRTGHQNIAPRPVWMGQEPPGNYPPADRLTNKRVSMACLSCKKSRRKCSGMSPCSSCTKLSQKCIFDKHWTSAGE
ncbi:hypothetical protein BJX76DRAFT_343044 [Aspergillus varians]